MKLPSKIEINNLKASERKREIDEGVKLAKKVDTLRELSAKEQDNLKKFRDATLKQIQDEIDGKIKEKNSLLKEIEDRKEERIKLSAPIDLTEEWEKVKDDKLKIEEWKRDLFDRDTNLILREGKVMTSEQEFIKRNDDLTETEMKAKQYFDEANKNYRIVEEIRLDMETKKEMSDKEINERYDTLLHKEQDFSKREQDFSIIKDQVEADKKEMLERGTNLIGREGMVEVKTQELINREETLKENENLNKRYLTESQSNYEETERLRLEMEKFKEETEKDISSRLQDVENKVKELEYREHNLNLEKEEVMREKTLIANEKLHITSQQETLRVAWANIKKLK